MNFSEQIAIDGVDTIYSQFGKQISGLIFLSQYQEDAFLGIDTNSTNTIVNTIVYVPSESLLSYISTDIEIWIGNLSNGNNTNASIIRSNHNCANILFPNSKQVNIVQCSGVGRYVFFITQQGQNGSIAIVEVAAYSLFMMNSQANAQANSICTEANCQYANKTGGDSTTQYILRSTFSYELSTHTSCWLSEPASNAQSPNLTISFPNGSFSTNDTIQVLLFGLYDNFFQRTLFNQNGDTISLSNQYGSTLAYQSSSENITNINSIGPIKPNLTSYWNAISITNPNYNQYGLCSVQVLASCNCETTFIQIDKFLKYQQTITLIVNDTAILLFNIYDSVSQRCGNHDGYSYCGSQCPIISNSTLSVNLCSDFSFGDLNFNFDQTNGNVYLVTNQSKLENITQQIDLSCQFQSTGAQIQFLTSRKYFSFPINVIIQCNNSIQNYSIKAPIISNQIYFIGSSNQSYIPLTSFLCTSPCQYNCSSNLEYSVITNTAFIILTQISSQYVIDWSRASAYDYGLYVVTIQATVYSGSQKMTVSTSFNLTIVQNTSQQCTNSKPTNISLTSPINQLYYLLGSPQQQLQLSFIITSNGNQIYCSITDLGYQFAFLDINKSAYYFFTTIDQATGIISYYTPTYIGQFQVYLVAALTLQVSPPIILYSDLIIINITVINSCLQSIDLVTVTPPPNFSSVTYLNYTIGDTTSNLIIPQFTVSGCCCNQSVIQYSFSALNQINTNQVVSFINHTFTNGQISIQWYSNQQTDVGVYYFSVYGSVTNQNLQNINGLAQFHLTVFRNNCTYSPIPINVIPSTLLNSNINYNLSDSSSQQNILISPFTLQQYNSSFCNSSNIVYFIQVVPLVQGQNTDFIQFNNNTLEISWIGAVSSNIGQYNITLIGNITSLTTNISAAELQINLTVSQKNNTAPILKNICSPQFLVAPNPFYQVTAGQQLSFTIVIIFGNAFQVSTNLGDASSFTTCNQIDSANEAQINCNISPLIQQSSSSSQASLIIQQVGCIPITTINFLINVVQADSVNQTETQQDNNTSNTSNSSSSQKSNSTSKNQQIVQPFLFTGGSSTDVFTAPPPGNFSQFKLPLAMSFYNISRTGLITIVYNQPIQTYISSLKLKYIQFSSEMPLKFTFNVTENKQNYIKIQMNFTQPLYVSSGQKPDHVSIFIPVEINQNSTTKRLLDNSKIQYFNLDLTLPTMVASETELKKIAQTAATTGSFMTATFWIYIVLAILLKGVIGMMWGLFQALQLITTFDILFVKIPANVLMIHQGFNSILSLQFIDKQLVYDYTIGKFWSQSSDSSSTSSNDAMNSLGYAKTNMVFSLIFLFILLVLFLFVSCILVICYKLVYPRMKQSLKNVFLSIKGKIMYNTILRTAIQCYLGLAISTLLAFKQLIKTPVLSIQPFLICFMILYLILFPMCCYWIVKRKQSELDSNSVKQTIGTLYINQDPKKIKSAKEYIMWFMYRRLILAITIVFLDFSQSILQVAITSYFSLFVCIYIALTCPFNNYYHNQLAIFNEFFVCTTCVLLLVFTDYVTDPVARYNLGYPYLYWLCSIVVINFLVLGYDLFLLFSRYCRKWKKKRAQQKNQKEKLNQKNQITSLNSSQIDFLYQDSQSKNAFIFKKKKIIDQENPMSITQLNSQYGNSFQNMTLHEIQALSVLNDEWNQKFIFPENDKKLNQEKVISLDNQNISDSDSYSVEQENNYQTQQNKVLIQKSLNDIDDSKQNHQISQRVDTPMDSFSFFQSEQFNIKSQIQQKSEWSERNMSKEEVSDITSDLIKLADAQSSMHLSDDFFKKSQVLQLNSAKQSVTTSVIQSELNKMQSERQFSKSKQI